MLRQSLLVWALTALSVFAENPSVRLDRLEIIDYVPTVQPSEYTGEIGVGAINPLPDWLLDLNGKTIDVRGFMYPLDFEDGVTREFLFLPFDLTCHFGDFPQIDEFFIVKMKDKGVRPELHLPSTLTGIVDIREIWEGGLPVSLLHLEGLGVDYTQ